MESPTWPNISVISELFTNSGGLDTKCIVTSQVEEQCLSRNHVIILEFEYLEFVCHDDDWELPIGCEKRPYEDQLRGWAPFISFQRGVCPIRALSTKAWL